MTETKYYAYGTSGFRFNENVMTKLSEKIGKAIGYVITLLNCQTTTKKNIGVMVTASHNIYTDNGIKLVDTNGDMIDSDMESLMEYIVNDTSNIEKYINDIFNVTINEKVFKYVSDKKVKFIIGHDTRRSCKEIIDGIKKGINSLIEVEFVDLGYRTTPELHISVLKYNEFSSPIIAGLGHEMKHDEIFPQKVSSQYLKFLKYLIFNYEIVLNDVFVDCANGVGAIAIGRMYYSDLSEYRPNVINYDFDSYQKLNHKSGSDYVLNNTDEFHKTLIDGLNQELDIDDVYSENNIVKVRENKLHFSFDGDADRIIMYRFNRNKFDIYDGDHISSLILLYILDVLRSKIDTIASVNYHKEIKIGVIHTAYSNGGFIDFVDNIIKTNERINKTFKSFNRPQIIIDRVCVPTGVKNLIKKANEYNIGIYFEANGHGSLIVNSNFGLYELIDLGRIFNTIIGDAIMNMIGIKHIIDKMDLKLDQLNEIFVKRYSKQVKLTVKDKSIYKPSYDQTELIEPKVVADNIRLIMKEYEGCRAFVRPSGTEDVLRLYVENNNSGSADLDALIEKIKSVIY